MWGRVKRSPRTWQAASRPRPAPEDKSESWRILGGPKREIFGERNIKTGRAKSWARTAEREGQRLTMKAYLARFYSARPWATAFIVAGVILLARIVVLTQSSLNLGPDEAQYWRWSETPALGYFSKPPLIAWLIALTTGVFGDVEWAIRLASPIAHAGAGLALFALARRLYDDRIAAWTLAAHATLPAVAFSSLILSTDAPLMFFWACALVSFERLLATRSMGWAALLGLAIGAGFLSKYAMIYFLVGGAMFFLLDAQARSLPLSRLAIVGLVAGAVLAPNVWWNANNEFETLNHTAANANWSSQLFNPGKLAKFVLDQFGVFGPIFFGALVWGVATLRRRLPIEPSALRADLFLLAFTAPPLVIVTVQAFISRAHANWAAASYPAALILVLVWLSRARRNRLIAGAVIMHAAIAITLSAISISFPLADRVGLSFGVERARGWREAGAFVAEAAARDPYDVIINHDRELMGVLLYYAQPRDLPILIWRKPGPPLSYYEATATFDPTAYENPLFVSVKPPPVPVADFEVIDSLTTDLGGGRSRTITLYRVRNIRT